MQHIYFIRKGSRESMYKLSLLSCVIHPTFYLHRRTGSSLTRRDGIWSIAGRTPKLVLGAICSQELPGKIETLRLGCFLSYLTAGSLHSPSFLFLFCSLSVRCPWTLSWSEFLMWSSRLPPPPLPPKTRRPLPSARMSSLTISALNPQFHSLSQAPGP